ncbi:MAG TPA: 3-oxoadipate enol-lactonase [Jiangellaceae bacterium]|nr:3-oxoadipate enol-lactonase [Jiangellaceae bacterium]
MSELRLPPVLGYDVHGPAGAPVVVLGSSLGTTRTMWDEQLPALSERYRVVRYDHRGHGGSPVPPGPYTVDDLGADLVALLDELGIVRAHHVGLSLGGIVAMWLAVHHPARVDRLALVCTGAHLPPAEAWLARAATVRARGMAAVAEAVADRWFTPAFATSARATDLRAGLRAVPVEGYAGCCEALAALDLRPQLFRIKAPTLVIAGRDDRATPTAYSDELAAGLPAGVCRGLAVVDGAAHLGSVERAEVITGLILEHLADEGDPDDHEQC